MKKFLLYRITKIDSGHYYIGAHAGHPDDGYMGSGKIIQRYVKKYGIDAFRKEILLEAPDETTLYLEEAKHVKTIDQDPLSLNITPGGNKPPRHGKGPSYRPTFPNGYNAKRAKKYKEQARQQFLTSNPMKTERGKAAFIASSRGHKKPDKYIKQMTTRVSNERWITDGTNNKKLHKKLQLPKGYRYGRTFSKTHYQSFCKGI